MTEQLNKLWAKELYLRSLVAEELNKLGAKELYLRSLVTNETIPIVILCWQWTER